MDYLLRIISAIILNYLSTVDSLPSGGFDSTVILTPLNNIGEIVNQKIEQKIQPKAYTFATPFPDSGRKHAVIEQESYISKLDTSYGRLQEFAADVFHPKPVVDTLEEHDKYGNDGEKARRVGTAVIGGFEALSNALNAAVEVPFEVSKQVGKKITNSLNQVGGKLVGLSYY